MSLLIVPTNSLTRAAQTVPLEDIDLSHIPHSVCADIAMMHVVLVVETGRFKILKDRHGIKQVDQVLPIKDLIFFLYRYNHDVAGVRSKDALNWIYKLTRFLDSKQLQELSREAEKKAFEKT